ncbi:MAG: hypothetical protein KAW92_01980 [Candidatus Cloacimonetes bacterium]|nr:hypothetical protein [Candidatus Cloacimonadota bacterium]
MDEKKFWDRFNILKKNIYGNHYKLENLIKTQLDEEGLDFFKDSETVLGRFESTLPKFCKACENNIQNLNQYMLINLLFSYVHLNDLKNARHIR